LEPIKHLALDRERQAAAGEEIIDPTAGCEDELGGAVLGASGANIHALPIGRPGDDWFVVAQRRAVTGGEGEMRRDAPFRKENARTRFPDAQHIVLGSKGG